MQSAPAGNTEIILVNDGSADSSAKICQRLSEENDCVKFINKSHGGAASARNAGLEPACGEFILFCDADDYVAPDYFNEIEKFKNEDLVVFGYTAVYEHSMDFREIPHKILRCGDDFEKLASLYQSRRLYELYTKRFKRSIIEQNGICFHEELPICEDMNFLPAICTLLQKHCGKKRTALFLQPHKQKFRYTQPQNVACEAFSQGIRHCG